MSTAAGFPWPASPALVRFQPGTDPLLIFLTGIFQWRKLHIQHMRRRKSNLRVPGARCHETTWFVATVLQMSMAGGAGILSRHGNGSPRDLQVCVTGEGCWRQNYHDAVHAGFPKDMLMELTAGSIQSADAATDATTVRRGMAGSNTNRQPRH
jgi:hypothetical protein